MMTMTMNYGESSFFDVITRANTDTHKKKPHTLLIPITQKIIFKTQNQDAIPSVLVQTGPQTHTPHTQHI